MLNAQYIKYLLRFKFPAGTSRGTLTHKETWFLKVWDDAAPDKFGLGECALFRGLSMDDKPEYEKILQECCSRINDTTFLSEELTQWPSIRFGLETALLDLKLGGERILFPSLFTQGEVGIPINGLIWMGPADFVTQQIAEKLNQGYRCLKMKIGAMQQETELAILRKIRKEFSPETLEIRLDANGAYEPSQALAVLNQFSSFSIHSVEQPIKPGNIRAMAALCQQSPIPVAVDEELIGINTQSRKQSLLTDIKPHYIILKPALTGSFTGALEWITEAEKLGIGWWITSALESNIGLNAIAQWTYSLNISVTQGLGTGSLYTNNIPSPLFIRNQELRYHPGQTWNLSDIGLNEK
jgi:L-alanine-DL-glutamate epimerase and related enzymes of enolase superfamily